MSDHSFKQGEQAADIALELIKRNADLYQQSASAFAVALATYLEFVLLQNNIGRSTEADATFRNFVDELAREQGQILQTALNQEQP